MTNDDFHSALMGYESIASNPHRIVWSACWHVTRLADADAKGDRFAYWWHRGALVNIAQRLEGL